MNAARRLAIAALLAALAGPVAGAGEDRVTRGAQLFGRHCEQCHGPLAEGNGPLAARYDPRPSNLRASTRSDDYKLQIISLGGAAMGRSPVMPEWGLELTGQEILALVEYLRSIAPAQEKGA